MQVSGLDFAAKFDTENAIIYFQAPQNEAPINFEWMLSEKGEDLEWRAIIWKDSI